MYVEIFVSWNGPSEFSTKAENIVKNSLSLMSHGGQTISLEDSVSPPTDAITNEATLKQFIFDQLKKCAKILLVKLRGGDDRNEPGDIFSNWEYVTLAASCIDNRKFDVPPGDYQNLPPGDQEI